MPLDPLRKDTYLRPRPDQVTMTGLLGERFRLSRENRLHHQEEDHLLWPFREHCPVGFAVPGRPHPEIRGDWQGEYIGTWIDAATLAAWCAHDEKLRTKIDAMVDEWLSCQQDDGYLGTYDEEDRWKSWDIWVQAHDIIGLFGYLRYRRDERALDAAIRIADRVLHDFGRGKRSIITTGLHAGLASSAILEPMIWLYWETGKEEYLEFCLWLVNEDWESDGGPKILSLLEAGRGVADIPSAKGIEMLICFAGLVELHRVTGDDRYFDAVETAWVDLVEHHLYITGTASVGEYFQTDYVYRNDGLFMVGETCVSKGWVYYLGLRDQKRYRWHTDPECCPSRAVRAMGHIPFNVYGVSEDAVYVNLYESGSFRTHLAGENIVGNEVASDGATGVGGAVVGLTVETDYPFDGVVTITVNEAPAEKFALKLRLPSWCTDYAVVINDEPIVAVCGEDGYITVVRRWCADDVARCEFEMPVRLVQDRYGNFGRVAVMRGPLVYAADSSYLLDKKQELYINHELVELDFENEHFPSVPLLDDLVLSLSSEDPASVISVKERVEGPPHLVVPTTASTSYTESGAWSERTRYEVVAGCDGAERTGELELVPFYDAGNRDPKNYKDGIHPNGERATDITFQVWLPYRCL